MGTEPQRVRNEHTHIYYFVCINQARNQSHPRNRPPKNIPYGFPRNHANSAQPKSGPTGKLQPHASLSRADERHKAGVAL